MKKKKREKINMNVSSWFVSLILTCVTSTVRSEGSANSGKLSALGKTSCGYFGDASVMCEKDNPVDYVSCDKLPPQCSSFVWESLTVDWLYHVKNTFTFEKVKEDSLQTLLKCSKKPVFMRYGYATYGQWTLALACCANNGINAKDEMQGIIAYLSTHEGITGMIIDNLDIDVDQGATGVPGLTDGLLTYISVFKETFPKLEIGLLFLARNFHVYYAKPNGEWLDFKRLNDVVDFYVLSYDYFNINCTDKLVSISMVPLKGDVEFTMEKIDPSIKMSGIPKEKLYLRSEVIPQKKVMDPKERYCIVNMKSMCQKPPDVCEWCADSLQTLYDKGVYTRENAQGFMYMYVDIDDPNGCCSCGRKFAGFYAYLDGFNNCPRPEPCALFDRL